MKRILALCLVCSLMLALAGCGDTRTDDTAETKTETAAPTADSASDTDTAETTAPAGDVTLYKDVVSVPDTLLDHEAAATDTGDITVTDQMITDSVINQGNITRLANAMVKAANGEEVTIAYLGGSITDGSSASPQATCCYAYLSYQWWVETFPDATINYVNAGIGATDSYLGVHRVQSDVLDYNPDVVIVEFSVNDYKQVCEESYESLIRRILAWDSEPAVVCLFLTQENFSDYQSVHQVLAYKAEVSMVSYRNVLYNCVEDGSLSWSDVGSTDGTHPVNAGHALIANLLTNFFRSVLEQIPTMEYKPYEIPSLTSTKCRYMDAEMLTSSEITPSACDGFDTTTISHPFSEAWRTTTGGSISFEVTGSNFGIVFYGTTDGKSGKFDVYLDDEYQTTIDGDFVGQWGSYADYTEITKLKESGTHTITIKKNPDSEGDMFTILGIEVS